MYVKLALKSTVHKETATGIKHMFLKYNREYSFEALSISGEEHKGGMIFGRQMHVSKKSTEYNAIHIPNICQKAFSENPNYAGKKVQLATSLNGLAKSAKKIYRLGLQQLGAHCLPTS